MKFTQEDLLNAMGLKVGDKIIVAYTEPLEVIAENNGCVLLCSDGNLTDVSEIVGLEYSVIPQPKYTLTEDEKRIVLGLNCGVLKRWNDRTVAWEVNGFVVAFFLNSYFNFITEPVSLDELQQIAKGETK